MPRRSAHAILIASIMTAGMGLFAQTNSAPSPVINFPNLVAIRADAAGGQALAQAKLGDYHLARGDVTNAVLWYRKAAEQGNAQAQLSLATCYMYGRGVAQDAEEALKWQRKAAVQFSQRHSPSVTQASPRVAALNEAAVAEPPAPPAPRERIRELPPVEPSLEAVKVAPLPSPLAEPVFVRSQLPRISAIPAAQIELEDIQLKVRAGE